MTRMLERDRAALIIVDLQEAFRPAVGEFDQVARNAAILAEGGRILGIPVVVTEQYPRGLGKTVPEVARAIEGIPRLEKVVFSAARADGFDLDGRDQALVCGIEAHVCVNQTVQDLLDRGVETHVASDAVTSRTAANRRAGLARMEASGAMLTSTEMALFELVGRAGTDEFKEVQRLVE
jgi:nicotinamidase-related amidase